MPGSWEGDPEGRRDLKGGARGLSWSGEPFSRVLWSQHSGDWRGRDLKGPHSLYGLKSSYRLGLIFNFLGVRSKTKAGTLTPGLVLQLFVLLPSPLSPGTGEAGRRVTWHKWGPAPGSPLGSLQRPGFPVFQATASCFSFFVSVVNVAVCPQPWDSLILKLQYPISKISMFLRSVETFLKRNIKLMYSYCRKEALFYFSINLTLSRSFQILKDRHTIYL